MILSGCQRADKGRRGAVNSFRNRKKKCKNGQVVAKPGDLKRRAKNQRVKRE